MNKTMFLLIVLLFILSSCDSMCGLSKERKKLLEESKAKFGKDYNIDNIPCEPYYLNVKIKKEFIDTLEVLEIQNMLIDKSNNQGWGSVHFYDSNDEFLFVTYENGKISKTAPNW